MNKKEYNYIVEFYDGLSSIRTHRIVASTDEEAFKKLSTITGNCYRPLVLEKHLVSCKHEGHN